MIKQAAATSYVFRSWGDFPDNTGDWTVLIQFKYNGIPSGFVNVLNFFDGAVDFTDPYLYLGNANSGVSDIFLEYFDGSVFHDTSIHAITSAAQNWAAITYKVSTTTLTFILNGSTIGTITASLAARTWDSLYLIGTTGSGSDSSSAAYLRAWSNVLSLGDLTAEVASITPVITTGLLFTNPLQTSVDLTAHNNTLNHFVGIGTVTTDTTDPLLSVVAGPPTNTTPANAIEITLDSAFFQDVNTAGVATDVWYKYQAVSADDVLGYISFGDLTTYKPLVLVYLSLVDANSNTQYEISGLGVQTDQNRAGIFPIPPSTLPFLYFNVARNGAVAASTLQFSLLRALSLPVPVGSIGINQDGTQGWPAVFLDQDTGYPIHFVRGVVGGNGGCTLPDGTLILTNHNTGEAEILDAQLNVTATIHPITALFGSGNLLDKFIISNNAVGSTAKIISPDGTIDPVNYVLSGKCQALALSRDSSIIYYTRPGLNEPVRRWDVATNTALSNLASGVSGYNSCLNEIIVLDDDSVLVNYYRTTPSKDIKIINYSAAGATLHTYDFGPFTEFAGEQNRIAGALDNLNQFYSWIKFTDDNSTGQFRRIKVSDGSILKFFTTIEYDSGNYQGLPVTAPVRFGNPDSCPMWVVRITLFPGNKAKSGLYILTGTGGNSGIPDNPILRHDVDWINTSLGTSENVPIPDPFYDTYLVGDE